MTMLLLGVVGLVTVGIRVVISLLIEAMEHPALCDQLLTNEHTIRFIDFVFGRETRLRILDAWLGERMRRRLQNQRLGIEDTMVMNDVLLEHLARASWALMQKEIDMGVGGTAHHYRRYLGQMDRHLVLNAPDADADVAGVESVSDSDSDSDSDDSIVSDQGFQYMF